MLDGPGHAPGEEDGEDHGQHRRDGDQAEGPVALFGDGGEDVAGAGLDEDGPVDAVDVVVASDDGVAVGVGELGFAGFDGGGLSGGGVVDGGVQDSGFE